MPDSTSQARRCGDLTGQPHRPGQVGDHLVERGGGPLVAQHRGVHAAGDHPEPLQQLVQRDAGPAQRVQRPLRVRRGGPLRPSAAPSSAPCSASSRSVVACDSSPISRRRSTSRARVSRRRDSRSSRGQLVGLADALVQLDAPLHAAQQEPGAVGHVLHEPLVGRGDRAVRLLDRQRGPQLRAVEHRHHVVGVGPGEQHREVVRGGRRQAVHRVGRGLDQPVVDGQPHHGALRAGALGEHLRQARQRLLERPGTDPSGRLGQHRVRRGEPVVGEPADEPVDRLAGRDHPRRRHPRGDERQQQPLALPDDAVEGDHQHQRTPRRSSPRPAAAAATSRRGPGSPEFRHSPSRCERR